MSQQSEPNGTFATADALTLGTAITGQLAASDDLDVYKFTVTAAGALSLTFDVPTNSSYSDYFALGLYDKDGVKLNLYTTGVDKTYQTSVAVASSYYLAVSTSCSLYFSGGSYSLTATQTAGSMGGFEAEANDTLPPGDEITLVSAMNVKLLTKSDVDCCSFKMKSLPKLLSIAHQPTGRKHHGVHVQGIQ